MKKQATQKAPADHSDNKNIWQNRIVGYSEKPAKDFKLNPKIREPIETFPSGLPKQYISNN